MTGNFCTIGRLIMTNPVYHGQFLRISMISLVMRQLSSKFCLKDWKIPDKFLIAKAKCGKTRRMFAQRQHRKTTKTFNFHWVICAGKTRDAPMKGQIGNPVPWQPIHSNSRNFHSYGKQVKFQLMWNTFCSFYRMLLTATCSLSSICWSSESRSHLSMLILQSKKCRWILVRWKPLRTGCGVIATDCSLWAVAMLYWSFC